MLRLLSMVDWAERVDLLGDTVFQAVSWGVEASRSAVPFSRTNVQASSRQLLHGCLEQILLAGVFADLDSKR